MLSTENPPAAAAVAGAGPRWAGQGAGALPGPAFYLAVARRSFRRQMAYWAANISGLLTNTFWGIIRASIFTALFAVQPHAAGLDLRLALTYGWLTEGMLMVTWLWGWTDVADAVRSGEVVADMARPYHLQTYWLARDLGRAGYHTLFRALPVVAVGACAYPWAWPASPPATVAFAASMVLGTVVSFAWRFLVNVTAFWTTDVRGMAAMAGLVAVFFSGEQLPIAFYPGWLQAIALALPFQAMITVPMNIYLGRTSGPAVLGALAVQVAWGAALLALGRYALGRGYRKVEANGG